MEMQRVTIRLSPADLATLDRQRGQADRSTYLRTLLRRSTRKPKAKPPTRAEALALLAEHAEHDPKAAIHLEQTLRGRDELERLRALTTD